MQTTTRQLAATIVSCLSLLALPIEPSSACGFHGLISGSLHPAHPRSIEVAAAIRAAVDAGVVDKDAVAPVVPGSAGYWRAAGRLKVFQQLLSAQSHRAPPAISMLFVDSYLWARLETTP